MEIGLDFSVSPDETGFWGAEARYLLKGRVRFLIWELRLEGDVAPGDGAVVRRDGRQVGVVTQAMLSPLNGWTVVIARLPVDCANEGTRLAVQHEGAATTTSMPLNDKDTALRRAKI